MVAALMTGISSLHSYNRTILLGINHRIIVSGGKGIIYCYDDLSIIYHSYRHRKAYRISTLNHVLPFFLLAHDPLSSPLRQYLQPHSFSLNRSYIYIYTTAPHTTTINTSSHTYSITTSLALLPFPQLPPAPVTNPLYPPLLPPHQTVVEQPPYPPPHTHAHTPHTPPPVKSPSEERLSEVGGIRSAV